MYSSEQKLVTHKLPTQIQQKVMSLGPAKGLCVVWALLSMVLFLTLGSPIAGDRAAWFVLVVSLLKVGAFLISAMICWRNAQRADILSGRTVWQAIAAGMAFHALGDITLILWRSLWGMTSAVSLGDIFYGVSYLFLAIGFLQAVLPRQINLSWQQSLGISGVGLVGIVLACWLNFYAPAVEGTSALAFESALEPNSELNTQPVASSEASVGITTTGVVAKGAVVSAGATANAETRSPAIIQLIDSRLSLVADKIGLLYVAGDCLLIVMAVALLVAFWGGSYSEAWKLIALGALCLYVADMFLIYDIGQGNYSPGAPWEFFWILSALLFGFGAEVEYGITHKMQQRKARKRWL